MAVLLTWSLTNGGSSLIEAVDHGNISNGQTATEQTIYVRHNGVNNITNCGIYITSETDDYEGSATASNDLTELIEWGNQITSTSFGGFMVNMDATGGFPGSGWPTYSVKEVTVGGNIVGNVCRTGKGDSATNAFSIPTQSGATSNGTIQTGSAPNVRIQCRFVAPTEEDTAGTRQVKTVMTYSYTS
jgi:hypothetical protein